jgi:hypothetical protein
VALVNSAFVLGFAALSWVDAQTVNGVSVWDKPAKFMLSFVVHALTFAWAFALMPDAERQSKTNRRLSLAFVAIFALEVAYMAFRAARGEASHFNTATPVAAVAYALMGIGATGLTLITAWFGWRLLKTRHDLAARSTGVGFILGALLGTLAGAYMSSQTGHWVGGLRDDSTGLPFFQWSTTGGDLRVAHFVGLHAMQAIPLAAWLWPHRRTVWIAAVAMTTLTGAVFAQALFGVPLLAV